MKYIYATGSFLLLICAFSCKVNIQKRHYMKGYYVGHSKDRSANKIHYSHATNPGTLKTHNGFASEMNAPVSLPKEKKPSSPTSLKKNVSHAPVKRIEITIKPHKVFSTIVDKVPFQSTKKKTHQVDSNLASICKIFQYLVYAILIYFTIVELFGPPLTIEVLLTHIVITLILFVIYLILYYKIQKSTQKTHINLSNPKNN